MCLALSAVQKIVLVMEFASKGSLQDFLDEHEVEPTLAQNLIGDIALGMHAIYKQGVEHRDLKAANVFLDEYHGDRRQSWRLGISKCTALMTHVSRTTSVDKTRSSGGTLPWKAPERLKKPYSFTQKSDVFSFAITAWEVLTRQEPWKKNWTKTKRMAVLDGDRPTFGHAEQGIGTASHSWTSCDKLGTSPDDRPSFSEVVQMLPKVQENKNTGIRRNN